MTFGKDAPPLPMYEHKVLKHVPTMVRRRYDRDLDDRFIATLGFPYEDNENKGDDGAEASNHSAVTVSDADDESEDELQAEYNNEQDSQTYTDDSGMFSEDSRRGSGGVEDENIVYVGLHIAEDSISEDNVTKDVNIVSDYVVDSVQDEVEDKNQGNSNSIQGFLSEDCKSIGCYGAEDSCSSPTAVTDLDVRVVSDEVEDKNQRNANNIQGFLSEDCKSIGYYGAEDSCRSPTAVTDLDVCIVSNEVEDKNQRNSNNIQGFLLEDCKSIGDYEAKDSCSSPAAVVHLDDRVVCNEVEETLTYTEDLGCIDFGQSTNNSKSEYDGAEDTNLAINKDANVVDEIEGDGHVKSDYVQDESKNESGEAEDVVDANVEYETEGDEDVKSDNEQGLCSEDCEIEDNGAIDEDALESHVNSSVKNEVHQDSEHTEKDLNVLEDIKSEGDGAKDADIACDHVDDNVQDKVEETNHENSENEHDICSDDCIDEEGAIDAKILANNEDTNVKNEVQDNESGLHLVHDSKSEGDGTEDVDIARRDVDDSVQDEVEDKGLDISESKQVDMLVEDSKSEVDATIHGNVDVCVKDEVLDTENDNKQDDSKSQDEGVKHDDLPSYEDVSVEVQDKGVESFSDEQEFCPKAFKETLERDGIDLLCPNCKNDITHTMIYQKKENIQQHQTTCYTFLTAIFSCMHSMVVHWRTNYRSHLD